MVYNVSGVIPYNMYMPLSAYSGSVYPEKSNVRFINRSKLPKNHTWQHQEKDDKLKTSDKFKIGCYIASIALFLGTIIYAACSKKVSPSKNMNIDNMGYASDNMYMLGDIIDSLT